MTQQDKQDDDRSGGKGANRAVESADSGAKAVDSAREPLKTAQERAKAALGTAEKGASVLLGEAKERLAPLDTWVKTTTQEHPYVVVSSAMGASFLAGIFMRRRTAVGLGMALGFIGGCLISGSGVKAARQPRKV